MRVRTETGTAYTLDLDDVDAYVRFSSAAAVTVTVPRNRVIPFAIGDTITVEQAGAGALTIAASGCTINAAETLVLAKQYASATLVKVGADEWTCSGYMTAA